MIILTLLFLLTNGNGNNVKSYKDATTNMTFSWHFNKDRLYVQISANTEGWICIGFNEFPSLSGTNLIMGVEEFEFYRMEDQYILGPGKHPVQESIGGMDCLLNRKVIKQGSLTTMNFSIPIIAKDIYHKNLIQGAEVYVLLGYSTSKDFTHHSRVRNTIKLKL